MAYARTWSLLTPAGSRLASQMDDAIREAKGDVQDRIGDIFGIADFTTDPIIPTMVKLNRTTISKILGGSTYLSIRNSGDSADNMIISDAGVVTLRNTLNGVTGIFTGAVNAQAFNGDGTGLTNLDATHLTGTISGARIVGTYAQITGIGTIVQGVWNATPIADAYLAGISGSKVSGAVANATNATTAASCTGNAATATTAGTCTGNAATATLATNSNQLGGVAAASYARRDVANNLTGNQIVSSGYMQANAFYVA